MKKLIALTLMIGMTMGLLAGCGGTDTSAPAAEAPAAEAPAADTSADAAPASGSTFLADGVLTVGTNAEFPPFEYVGDDGQPDGFDIALIKAIGDKLGVTVEVQNMEFDSLIASIGNKIDVAIAGMTVTDERKQSVDFSDSYYDAVQYVVLPKDSTIASIDDLAGKTIGVQLGTTGMFIAEDDIENANVSSYNKAVDAVNDLKNGKVEAVIIDKNPALVFTSKYPDDLVAVDGDQFGFGVENYAIAMPKGDTELSDAINKALKELKDDGTFDKLVSEYIEN
ncbi:MAG: basic amino acid ABC transporter substrate-binding protein [Lachnospiraceae bacterium]|nr:basic amino acid ABC transporter substrate-binding protein [Lachnospiraceae bacterium]